MEQVYLNVMNFPDNSLLNFNLDKMKVYKLDKTAFINSYNVALNLDSIKNILTAVFAKDFAELSIFFPSSKSKLIDPEYDRMWYFLTSSIRPIKRLVFQTQKVGFYNYNGIPYATYSKSYNQVTPDFIIFKTENVIDSLTK